MTANNHLTYLKKDVVKFYAKANSLQKPEQAIFNLLEPQFKNMRMLDIGVGGGRTTEHFADKVKDYKAIDYSPEMISACQKKFKGQILPESFFVADARDLSRFANGSFDFILFSFNGLDYTNHPDRAKAFNMIKRILAPGGYLCFSSHNLQSVDDMLKIKFRFNLLALAKRILDQKKLLELNKNKNYKTADFEMINDGIHDFGLETYYVKPGHQIKVLQELGFNEIKVFGTEGKELSANDLKDNTDSWLYYLCN